MVSYVVNGEPRAYVRSVHHHPVGPSARGLDAGQSRIAADGAYFEGALGVRRQGAEEDDASFFRTLAVLAYTWDRARVAQRVHDRLR